jgi:cellulose biosynthesis protein BcsQ
MPVALEPAPSIPPLVVVAHEDPAIAESLRHAVESAAGWQVQVALPSVAGLTAALAAGPSVAVIGCTVLANLPATRRTPVVAVGDDDHPAHVRAAMAAGARSLLAWPDGAADLPGELARVAATAADSGLTIATRGVQGGAGTTTIATHLAAAWSRWGPSPVLLLDLAGGLAFRLDLGAVASWSSLFPAADHPAIRARTWVDPYDLEPGVPLGTENPECAMWPVAPVFAGDGMDDGNRPADNAHRTQDGGRDYDEFPELGSGLDPDGPPKLGWPYQSGRVDPASLGGSLAEPWPGLSVLPLSDLVDGVADPPPDPDDVASVLEAAATAYRVIVVDLPVAGGPVVEAALARADVLIAVGRCETAGVRGLQAAIGAWTAVGRDPDTVGAVVTGVRPRAPLAPREVRAALGDGLWALVPAASAELAAAAEDGVLLLDRHDLPATQAMVTLANRVVPFTGVPA